MGPGFVDGWRESVPSAIRPCWRLTQRGPGLRHPAIRHPNRQFFVVYQMARDKYRSALSEPKHSDRKEDQENGALEPNDYGFSVITTGVCTSNTLTVYETI
jgi:hypothetical protein